MAGEAAGGGVRVLLAAVALVILAAAAASAQAQSSEADVLKAFRAALRGPAGGPPEELNSWVNPNAGQPCAGETAQWARVRKCTGGRVVVLQLENLQLQGSTPDLGLLAPLQGLRALSLAGNALTGAFPDVSTLPALKFLFLSQNGLSGEIPDGAFAALWELQKLDLSNNEFSGPIPSSIATSGKLLDVNLSSNNFSGPVPKGLLRLGANLHVQGNKYLCGTPVGHPCPSSSPA